jgi:hypothetical protein
VQLAPADQHGADLGQLAQVAGAAVRLDVDGDELGCRQGYLRRLHEPASIRPRPDEMHASARCA